MADPIVWGELPKAQDDPQTIAEAIAAAIAAHEADPEAHLGDGESLESHRANDIIDHPAGSLLADKWTMSELEFSTNFENIDIFGTNGDIFQLFPGVSIEPVGTGDGNAGKLIAAFEEQNILFDDGEPSLFQFPLSCDAPNNTTIVIKMGWNDSITARSGMGLEIVNGTARFFTGHYGGTDTEYLNWPGYTDLVRNIIRLQNVPDEGGVKVYIDGELLGTLEWANPYGSDYGGASAYVSRSSSNLPILYQYYWYMQLPLVN